MHLTKYLNDENETGILYCIVLLLIDHKIIGMQIKHNTSKVVIKITYL